jgi:F-type H+-transporting ATPase subunit alpha
MSVHEPLHTGLLSVDAMIPIGRGQRELILGDRQTDKSSIGLDTVLNQRKSRIPAVFCPIGQKASSILDSLVSLVSRDSLFFSSTLLSSASTPVVAIYLCAYSGSSLSEFLMCLFEMPVFILLDDLTKHAAAFREIYPLLRVPPGREAFPGEIFFVHSRLLERSCKLSQLVGGGSLTAFPVLETLSSDVSSFITTNVVSITDGQISLSLNLFLTGFKPAVDLGLSVSRIGSAAQWQGTKLVAGSYKLELSQYSELQSFVLFSQDLGHDTQLQLAEGARLTSLIKQPNGYPMPLPTQTFTLTHHRSLSSYCSF